MDWNAYSQWYQQHFEREINDFVSFIIHELDVDYQARILDVGCGPGWVSLKLAQRLPDAEIIGLDSNAELLNHSNQNKQQENIANVNFINSKPENLSIFSSHSFDAVISFKTFHQWHDPYQAMNEFNRILKKNGKYAISDYRRDLKLLAKVSIWFSSKTIPPDFRSHWKMMFLKCYSLEEILKILLKTELKDWKIRTTLFDYMIYKLSADAF